MFESLTTVLAMAPQGDGDQSMMPTFIMFGAVILIMYFLMIRPQQKRQKEHKAMLESIKRGDKVVTSSGMHGTVTDINGTEYVVQIADNVKVTFDKAAISAKK